MLPWGWNLHTSSAAAPCLVSAGPAQINISIVKIWRAAMKARGVEQWSRREKPSSLRRITGVNQWSIESHITVCEEKGNAAVVQHVRVIPARLLNFGSHKVIVYGDFSALKYKAVWHFAFSAFVWKFLHVGIWMAKWWLECKSWKCQISRLIINKAVCIMLIFRSTGD